MSQQAHQFFEVLKNDKSTKEVITQLKKFENYMVNLCERLSPNGFKDNFIYHWTFKHIQSNQDNINNYVKANLFAAKNSLSRLNNKVEEREIHSVIRRMLTDFVCDLKPFITKFDKNQDYSWLLMNTNSHASNFYYHLSKNIFLNGKPGTHQEEKLALASSTPFIIRQSIEYKLKRILGIDYWLVDGRPDINTMDKCFKIIKANHRFYKTRDFDFDIIRQIYRWTNIYVHGGYRPEPWRTENALFCLKNLFYKGQALSSNLLSWYAGIEVLESDLPELLKNTEQLIEKMSNKPVEINWLSKPEVAIIKS